MKKTTFAGLILVGVAVTTFAQERFVRPADDARSDASFLAFRTKLIAAAERKDANAILAIVDPNIKNGFGGEDGIAKFRRGWKLTNKNSEFWKEFLPVIKNGGGFSKEGNNTKMFVAPYTFSDWPDDLDVFEYHVIFGNNVNLRDRPSMEGKVIGSLSYNVVKMGEGSTTRRTGPGEFDLESDWFNVKTLGGKEGFVKAEFVRSGIDYRAGFEKKRGVWKMTFFLAGD